MSADSDDVQVFYDEAACGYVLTVDGERAGVAEVVLDDGLAIFTHTEIAPEFGGRGLGSVLLGRALADVAAQELAVEARCGFVASYLAEAPRRGARGRPDSTKALGVSVRGPRAIVGRQIRRPARPARPGAERSSRCRERSPGDDQPSGPYGRPRCRPPPTRVAPSALSTVLRSAQQLRPLPVQVTPSRLAAALPMETVLDPFADGSQGRWDAGCRATRLHRLIHRSGRPRTPTRTGLWTKIVDESARRASVAPGDVLSVEPRAIADDGIRHRPRRPV